MSELLVYIYGYKPGAFFMPVLLFCEIYGHGWDIDCFAVSL